MNHVMAIVAMACGIMLGWTAPILFNIGDGTFFGSKTPGVREILTAWLVAGLLAAVLYTVMLLLTGVLAWNISSAFQSGS